jgi:hypothetical protein
MHVMNGDGYGYGSGSGNGRPSPYPVGLYDSTDNMPALLAVAQLINNNI